MRFNLFVVFLKEKCFPKFKELSSFKILSSRHLKKCYFVIKKILKVLHLNLNEEDFSWTTVIFFSLIKSILRNPSVSFKTYLQTENKIRMNNWWGKIKLMKKMLNLGDKYIKLIKNKFIVLWYKRNRFIRK